MFQKIRGHRWSTDDLCTAWFAINSFYRFFKTDSISPLNYIDLGCGIGSVLLMIIWKFRLACFNFYGVEAQQLSYSLAQRNINFNLGDENKVQLFNHDIRKLHEIKDLEGMKFDLITGTPPYFRIISEEGELGELETFSGFGGLPTCKQSAPARYEFRGGVEDYCFAAKSLMNENSLFIVCQGVTPKENERRVVTGAATSGLKIIDQFNFKGNINKPVLFSVYCMVLRESAMYNHLKDIKTERQQIYKEISIRQGNGERSQEYKNLMAEMSIPA